MQIYIHFIRLEKDVIEVKQLCYVSGLKSVLNVILQFFVLKK